ncbi:thiamine pyrophosphate-binding protein [Rhodococcus opacus]
MKFHQAIARALVGDGVEVIFGVIGDANLFMMDSFRDIGGTYVSTSHEAGAVLAANGYAQTSGKLGVASVTHGPGLTNTVTALVESVKSHTPILVVCGDTAVVDRENLQSIGQREMVLATGSGFEQVRAPETMMEDVSTAARRARVEQRPVVLNVPADFQWSDVEVGAKTVSAVVPTAGGGGADALEEAVGVIANARRPVIVAGRGAASAPARSALLRLATKIGAPVATSLGGKDLFRGEDFDLGIAGTLAHEIALETLLKSDCVIAFGARLNKWTTAEGSLVEGKHVVHVDMSRDAIGRWSKATVGIVGDAAAVADAMVALIEEADIRPTGFASERLKQCLASRYQHPDPPSERRIELRTAMRMIDAAFPSERTLVLDGGRFVFNAFNLFHVPDPTAFVHTLNFGSIGLGMGNALGAAFGRPDRPVLLVAGDGGFMLGGLVEFSSAVRHHADVVVIVFNDGAYGAEHIQFRRRDMDASISTFEWPDFGPVATSLGGLGLTVRTAADLELALDAVARRDRPVLIDIKIDPEQVDAAGH